MADNSKLDYFKKKIMAILNKQSDDVSPAINKALEQIDFVHKSFDYETFGELQKSRGYGIGTIREWKGHKYKKIAPNKWRRVYDKTDRGAKMSITLLKKAVANASSVEELMKICMENKDRFKDSNGVDLPILNELRAAVDAKNDEITNGKKPSTQIPEKKPETDVKNTADYKKKFKESYEYFKKIGTNNTKEQLKEQVSLMERDLKENKNNENDPNFMGQYQARLELLADKANEKKEEKPAEDPVKAVKEEMKQWNKLYDFYKDDNENGVAHWFEWASRPGQEVDSKAFGKFNGIKNLIKMKETLEKDYGMKTPEIPKDILDKYNQYLEATNGKARWSIPWETHKILSGIKASKLEEVFNNTIRPIVDRYEEAKNKLPKEDNEKKVTPVAGLSNEEHANLFEMKKDEFAADDNYPYILTYNGQPYGSGHYSEFYAKRALVDTQDLVKNAGMNTKDQVDYYFNKLDSNHDKVAYQWSIDSALKKLSDKKLKEIAKPSMSDEEFKNLIYKSCEEKTRAPSWIEDQVSTHIRNKMYEETAAKMLKEREESQEAINGIDLPVDPADMNEAENIIGRDVNRVLNAEWDVSRNNARQNLKSKIEARIRNNPAVARAMLVYIKNKQEETGKTVFTPKNEIWKWLPKLNENALKAIENGETETKGGTSGEMFTGDDISSVVEDKDAGRYKITFHGKPDYETRTLLKQNGFRWTPSEGVWQCYNTAHGESSLNRVAEALGWKKNK